MASVTYNGSTYQCSSSDTVLDVLLQNGVDVPYSCQEGFCHTCVMRAVEGSPSRESQEDMTPEEIEKNDFLACKCKVEGTLTVGIPGNEANQDYKAKIIEKKFLSKSMVQIKCRVDGNFNYKPGQYLNIVRDDGLIRSYSIASVPENGEPVELHIQKIEGGKMSTWLHSQVFAGSTLTVHGPYGSFFYETGRSDQEMIMIATGSGLAPLWGILREAIRNHHKGKIQVFHGSRFQDGLYYVDEMKDLAAKHPNLEYYPCLSGPDVPETFEKGRADDVAVKKNIRMKNMRVFLCGHPEMVERMKKKAFIAGAEKSDILVDPFVFSS
ncbi:MAG: 2Fe-2S iron-sulfur cluster-binding protein [Spirochaetia bacterium]|nr:2Fe-2S iron-sulfur cluster-binding protein [Spirochaetia bacterium]